jgi:hypothetical protein
MGPDAEGVPLRKATVEQVTTLLGWNQLLGFFIEDVS